MMTERFFFAFKLFFLVIVTKLRLETLTRDVFLWFASFFEQIYYAFAEKPDELFWERLKKMTFAFAEKRLEHLESREILCDHHPKSLKALKDREYKILTEQIHCLRKNVPIICPLRRINQQMTKGNRRCISIPVN